MAGNSVRVVSLSLGVSESIIQEWHDEIVVDILKSGSSKRLFLRDLLLKNSPTMILKLCELAKQNVDEKLAYSAASSVLAFASRFMNEDLKISNMEEKAKTATGNDPMFKKTLFDFLDPDLEGNKINENKAMHKRVQEEIPPELLAFLQSMDEENAPEEEIPPEAQTKGSTPDVSLFDGIDVDLDD